MASLTVVGVRHHSPACARVVAHAIDELRPRFVLIEGPCDMNARLGELRLGHTLPLAIYTYRLAADGGRARGSWSPFCAHSPEWIALQHGAASGAETLFIDLPAWDDAFAETENRYSDEHLQISDRIREISQQLGFDSVDTLWDHLFEQPADPRDVQRELERYFLALRADEDPGPRDARREAWMARWIAWAMAQAGASGNVLVVCGGYHKPALERLWSASATERPEVEAPAERVGSYLVPFSFRRLDSFTGYASGMPSPAWYQELWERPAEAHEALLFRAAHRLRAKGQRVSTADVRAASELSHGLASLRGHAVPTRTDVLDGLLGALLKEALGAPAPWTIRGPLPRGTDPFLVEVVAAFSGDAQGALAPETPRPPLLADLEAELKRVGIRWTDEASALEVDPLSADAQGRRQVLYRLALLGIPGVERTRAADLRRGAEQPNERWKLWRGPETEATLIERAAYGATLEQAAVARLMELLQSADSVAPLALALEQAVLAGFEPMARELAEKARAAVEREVAFAPLGTALERFRLLARTAAVGSQLAPLIEATVERALWLLEGIDGTGAKVTREDLTGVIALRSCLREPELLGPPQRAATFAVLARRAHAASAPPMIRGAALGALWSVPDPSAPTDEAAAAETLRGTPTDGLGAFLSGLFALAREEFLGSSLLAVVDARLAELGQDSFLSVLPSLRRAFAWFPPRERVAIAQRLLGSRGLRGEARALLDAPFSVEDVQRGARLEAEVMRVAERYHLLGEVSRDG